MTSPAKRPAVTYQKGPHRKIATTTTTTTSASFSSTLNPDAALQQKINDLLFSKGNETTLSTGRQVEEFDSAYQETTVLELKIIIIIINISFFHFFIGKC